MRRKQKILLSVILPACLVAVFFLGYFFSVIQLMSWDVFISKPINEWFKQQNAIYFDADQVDELNIEAFNKVKNVLENKYYKEVDFNEAFSHAIKGLSAGLDDPYTLYYTPEEMKAYLEGVSGNYVGIGVSVHMDENYLLTVADVFADSPAKEAGILKNDKIVKVDNEDVTTIRDADLIVKKIKGEPDTKVRITIYRPDERIYKEFELIRRVINISWISSEVLDEDIGYIHIKQFDDDIYRDFEVHLNNLMAKGIRGLVIDLRDNPGGSYYQVAQIADRIVPKGLIVYTEDRHKNRREQYSDERELEIPLAVLVNGYSASASEILAACVQDYDKGIIVGTKTFGKGLVQEIDIDFKNGGGLKYTKARYFTPSGKSIHGEGVIPDVEIELSEEFNTTSIEDIPHDKDNQLKIAIAEVMAKIKE
ncbi:MAG: S41 family peptidase [Clostridiaceae bacterium]|jgi:carboxyl-terminal processing protease|nr:S41 family peptidase [Clostridiaceae bacterium]